MKKFCEFSAKVLTICPFNDKILWLPALCRWLQYDYIFPRVAGML